MNPIDIFSEFDLGKIKSIDRLSGGIVNQTYMVTSEEGKFVLQKDALTFQAKKILEPSALLFMLRPGLI